jgi:hypothetical protein
LLYARFNTTILSLLQGLCNLRRLDVSGNALRRLEVLRPAASLSLLGELDVAANPLEAAQNVRLYIVYLLPQVSSCYGGGGVGDDSTNGLLDCAATGGGKGCRVLRGPPQAVCQLDSRQQLQPIDSLLSHFLHVWATGQPPEWHCCHV